MPCEPVLAISTTSEPHKAVPASVLPPSLLSCSQREGLAFEISVSPFPSFGESSRNSPGACHSGPATLCLPTTKANLSEGEGLVSPCRHLLGFGLSWEGQLKPEESCDPGQSQACFIYHCTSSVNQVIMNSHQTYSLASFCIAGKSGASMCWCSWASSLVRGTPPGRHSGTWCLQVRFSAFNPEGSALPPGPQHRLWRGSAGG